MLIPLSLKHIGWVSTHKCERPLKVHDGARDGREGVWARDWGQGLALLHAMFQCSTQRRLNFNLINCYGGVFIKIGEKNIFYLYVFI